MIYDTTKLYRDSIGWYRKNFQVEKEDLKGKLALRFDGVYMNSTVFVNGRQVGEWKYGYSTFEFDITDYVREGNNQVVVRVIFQHCNSRWYSGAGIYRNVWLKKYAKEHIAPDGVYVSMKVQENGDFTVELETEINLNHGDDMVTKFVRQSIFTLDHKLVAQGSFGYDEASCIRKQDATIDSEEAWVYAQTLEVKQPLLWKIGQGNLYTLRTELLWGDAVIDCEEEHIGFKEMNFDANNGFFLNGEHIKLNGVCEHHDFGCLGAAFYEDAMRRKFEKLRKMGVNAIRTSHNMPAPGLMELADEMGFLVFSEAFDMWEMGKTTYDYGRFFKEWCERDVRSWVRRDRNHVSLLMWSIGNEIYDTQASEHGQEITRRLIAAVREHDPKKNAPTTIASNFMKWENGQKCAELVDCVGYNNGEYLYEEHHREHPDWIIYGSETASMLSSRSIYHFPADRNILTDEDEQCSSLGNSVAGWGAMSYEDTIFDDRDAKYSLGQFLWTGFDYIGESMPYNTKNSYFGQLDTAGFPKDSYYVF
ncbi:glycoside hydrolase family 2 TIM barrel-domain containing protein [Robinsoniella peoriensis]|uniref:glycoside hydrolase family 2 TIM barrel-domain containing protein n=1 Tax=Robinsoniella peoriensis TaxID=180332 RepID=UPI000A66A0CD|nr:glycoside hydrolase family 2 TIM barrel-domain containing protein [Robinsoniella peoriensis]